MRPHLICGGVERTLLIALVLSIQATSSYGQSENNDVIFELSKAEKLEVIVTDVKSRLASLDPAAAESGAFKYLVLSEQERDTLTLYSGSEAEIQQFEKDQAKIHEAVYSDYETYHLYSDLMEFIDDSLFMREQMDVRSYWSPEKKLAIIRQLDAKFANEPAWARYWNYRFGKVLEFMEKYG